MVMINRATKEITFKVVYYGPGLCGKTTNLEKIYDTANPKNKGKLLTVATETDRTLFFDFLPMELGTIRGMKVRVQLYTVPGQVFYDATRRIVLRGSDGVVFVADSQRVMMDANVESLENLKANLKLNGLDPDSVPLALQYNKQDLTDVATQEELDATLNWRGVPSFLSVATVGTGVNETLKKIIELVIRRVQATDAQFGGRPEAPKAEPAQPAPPPEPVPPPLPEPPPPPEAPEPPAYLQQQERAALPEVELEERNGPTPEEPDMEAVEIESLQDVEPLPMPTLSATEPRAVPAGEEDLPVEVVEEAPEPLPLPSPKEVDVAQLRETLAALQDAVDTVAHRARALADEAEALRKQVEQAARDILP